MTARSFDRVIAAAGRALVLGIGGGGDVVGALAVGRLCESLGTPFALGGVAWERFAIDPVPGPRGLDEVEGGERVADAALLAGPDTRTADGLRFSESRMAGFLGSPVALIDVSGGPAAIAEGVVAAAVRLDCDLIVYVDVGGDVLAHGGEPGLASPLCDALMLAAADRAAKRVAALGAVFGPGCDAELSAEEVLDRIAALARDDGWLGAWGLPGPVADELEAAAGEVPTEASLQAVRCARGETGETTIRGGRRTLRLGPIGALTLFFDPRVALAGHAPLARAVAVAGDLEAGRAALAALGVRTELDYERGRAAGRADVPDA